jgi:phage anti-repressor protein/predicted GIY-YIG superfamily endonuclease
MNNYFLDEFLGFYNERTLSTDLVINLEKVALWLDAPKSALKKTLLESYKRNIDYSVSRIKKEKKSGSGGINKELIMITPDTFKRMCMLSRTKKGGEVRQYFIELENLINRYKTYIIESLNKKIGLLENNQKPIVTKDKGVIYIIQASDEENDSLYKLGKTTDIKKRIKNYNTGKADNVTVLFVYEVNDIDTVEKCVKTQMKKFQYRKYKEVYQININILKEVIQKCDDFEVLFKSPDVSFKQLGGNLYLVYDK